MAGQQIVVGPRPGSNIVGPHATVLVPVGTPEQIRLVSQKRVLVGGNTKIAPLVASTPVVPGSPSQVRPGQLVLAPKDGVQKWYDFVEYKPKSSADSSTTLVAANAPTPTSSTTTKSTSVSKTITQPQPILLSPTSTQQPTFTLVRVPPPPSSQSLTTTTQPKLPPQQAYHSLAPLKITQPGATLAPVRAPFFPKTPLNQLVALTQHIPSSSTTTTGNSVVVASNNTTSSNNNEVILVSPTAIKPASQKSTAFQCKKVRFASLFWGWGDPILENAEICGGSYDKKIE